LRLKALEHLAYSHCSNCGENSDAKGRKWGLTLGYRKSGDNGCSKGGYRQLIGEFSLVWGKFQLHRGLLVWSIAKP
jgi:hypothetical protein